MMNNLELMRKRLEFQGGIKQEDRMIQEKYRTLKKAFLYSYQGCDVTLAQPRDYKLQENENLVGIFPQYRALINPDKLKQDYDTKVLSIDYAKGYKTGDIFYWVGTQSYWIIYLEELTEDGYFRGDIRRCRYQIKYRDDDGNILATWAAIRGPVETQIDSIQKNQVRVDRPNLSLNILIPQNEYTLKAFDRYSEFIFAGRCWRVEAPDIISMDGIIEVNAEEYFIDRDTDKNVKNDLVIEPVNPTPESKIIGETFIKPKIEEIYEAPEQGGKWCLCENSPARIISYTNTKVKVIWDKMTSGQFKLRWSKGDKTDIKVIVVESLM